MIHLSDRDNSIPELEIMFGLDAKIKSMKQKELFITRVG